MNIVLRLDENDKSMVLMYVGEYLMGAAHIDCFEDLFITNNYEEEVNTFMLLQDFTEVEVKLEIINPESYFIEEE